MDEDKVRFESLYSHVENIEGRLCKSVDEFADYKKKFEKLENVLDNAYRRIDVLEYLVNTIMDLSKQDISQMDIHIIETYLRRKKLEFLNKK